MTIYLSPTGELISAQSNGDMPSQILIQYPTGTLETNMAIWYPSSRIFEKALAATIFNRITIKSINGETLFNRTTTDTTNAKIAAAMLATPNVTPDFCVLVKDAILIFSSDAWEHGRNWVKVINMTIAHDMDIVDDDCVRNVSTAAEAGVWLQEMQGKAFMLVKGRIPERPTKTGPFQEATLQPEVPEGGRVRSSWESYTSVDAKGAADGGIRDRSGTLDSFATTYTSAAPSDRSTPEA